MIVRVGRADDQREVTLRFLTGTMNVMTNPSTIEREDLSQEIDLAPDTPWVVIVWNDPINLMSYVSWVFRKLFGYSKDKADLLMLDVHEKGRAVVSNGPREKAELDVFRLHEHGLWATMQRDGSDSGR